jgi:hypothetical protein
VGLAAHALLPARAPLGPEFTAPRARVVAAADSALRAWGADPAAWRRLVAARAGPSGIARRFLVQSLGHDRAVERAQALAATYLPAAWWDVRYVRTAGPVAERAEEWRVRVLPDGRVLDVRHPVPEGRAGASPTPDSARAVLRQALATAGVSRAGCARWSCGRRRAPAGSTRASSSRTPPPRYPTPRARGCGSLSPAPTRSRHARGRAPGALPARRTRARQPPHAGDRARRRGRGRARARADRGRHAPAGAPHARRLLDRRAAFALGAGATLAAVAPQLNAFSETLADWDTAAPWTTYLAQAAISVAIGAAAVGAAAAALWLTADALRRRTSIPFWPEPGAARDALAAGAALGAGSGSPPSSSSGSARVPGPPRRPRRSTRSRRCSGGRSA